MALSFNRFQQKTQYLQLQAMEVNCCIALQQVQKIFSLMALNAVPNTPDYLAGVFNYHGSIVPVLDLSLRLGQQPDSGYNTNTCVVLCSTLESEALLGLIVSAVGNVIEISRNQLQLAPQFSGKSPPFFAIYQQQQACYFILNTDTLLGSSLSELYSVPAAEINQIIKQFNGNE